MKLQFIALDESEYYNLNDILGEDDAKWVRRIEEIVLVDKDLDVHYCSAQGQPQTWHVETRTCFKHGAPEDVIERVRGQIDDQPYGGEDPTLMSWTTIGPALKARAGKAGGYRRAPVPRAWITRALEDMDDLDDPPSMDPRFMGEIVSMFQATAIL